MTAVQPLSTAAALWNRLLDLGRDDGVELARINWQLRGMAAKFPGDFPVRLAAARGLLLAGDRSSAEPHLTAAFNLRGSVGLRERLNLLGELEWAGVLDKALIVQREVLADPQIIHLDGAEANCISLALRVGDCDLLRLVQKSFGEHSRQVPVVLGFLNEHGVLPYLERHQALVEEMIGTVACGCAIEVGIDEDTGDWRIDYDYYVPLPPAERFDLLWRTHERLGDVYADHPDGPGAYIGLIGVSAGSAYIPVPREAA